ncbi:MAG TPA: hypothetical protein VHB54_01795 [Mucilaginibacter sp.]|nr:hypothetical protein [Mucilaginibacter sp.]
MRAEAIQLDFKGVVDSVSYSEKDEPTVSIGGKSFVLPVNFWDFNKQIEVGDSLVKHKNSLTIEIIKKNGTVIIKN